MIDPSDPNPPHKFSDSVNLISIKTVKAVKSKRNVKFDVIETNGKIYHFKAKSEEQRDMWVYGLQMHIEAGWKMVDFMKERSISK